MKWSWDLMHQWKAAIVTFTMASGSDKNGTLPNGCSGLTDGTGSEDLDLKVNVNGTSQWKRWSVGSDTNGAYAKVENGLDSDLDEMTIPCGQLVAAADTTTTTLKSTRNDRNSVHPAANGHVQNRHSDLGFLKCQVLTESCFEYPKGLGLRQPRLSWAFGTTCHDARGLTSVPPFQDKWRILFDRFDREGFGEIPWPDFLEALKSPEFLEALEPGKIQLLSDLAHDDSNQTTAITFQHFVNIMSGKRSRSFKCALHHRDRQVCSESDFHLLPFGYQSPSGVKRMARLIADEFLTDERDRKYYADHYRCLPPPLFIISITLIELGFFTYYTVWHGEVSSSGPLPIDSIFVYRPDKRQEVWRFFFYMVLHAGWVHLMFNLLVQLLVGLPLEMVHGSLRIGCVYMAGVLAGSLGTSVFDPDVYLVGASGGVYALLAAHLANVLLNYNNMEFGLVRLLGVFLIASVDVGFAIYDRYAALPPLTDGSIPPVSYVAHLTGALAGLTIGLLVLKNFEQKLREQLMWWLALGIYGACTLFAILFNIFHPTYPYNIT